MRFLITAAAVVFSVGFAQWGVDISTGTSAHPSSVLTVSQVGYPDEVILAHWETRPWVNWKDPTENYYTVRIRYAEFELELVHDRVILKNPNDVINHFEITDGLNLLMVNYAPVVWEQGDFEVLARVGMGVSIPNVTNEVRGEKLGFHGHRNGNRYYFGSYAFQIGAQVKYWFSDWAGLSVDGKYTFTAPRTAVFNGSSHTEYHGFHVGFGVTLRIP